MWMGVPDSCLELAGVSLDKSQASGGKAGKGGMLTVTGRLCVAAGAPEPVALGEALMEEYVGGRLSGVLLGTAELLQLASVPLQSAKLNVPTREAVPTTCPSPPAVFAVVAAFFLLPLRLPPLPPLQCR